MKKFILFFCLVLFPLSNVCALEKNLSNVDNVGLFVSNSSQEACRLLLEKFCKQFYSEIFGGRTFEPGSISISSVSVDDDDNIVVKGTHTYSGRLGTKYTGYEFRAVLTMYGNNKVRIEFNKQSAPDLTHWSVYWEKGTRIMIL